jgi:hypothetical protein
VLYQCNIIILDTQLGAQGMEGIGERFLEKRDAKKVLSELHDRPTGGNYGGDTTAHKILREGYYWPSIFKYAHAYARKCQ